MFADVTVYADKGLTKELCTLKNGSRVQGFEFEYELLLSEFEESEELAGDAVYRVALGDLSELCAGHASGYIGLPEVEVDGERTWLVPFAAFLGQVK